MQWRSQRGTGRVDIEAVDLMIGRLCPVVRALGGALIVTADQGNADEMFERDKVGQGQAA
ncbi:MAG: hypothetical protein IPM79_18575 [Polyangiaceae bacterium]|jgi:2,3-bisphosphoglycerate-independent phosphoglycerate mutase|nr:hypothetical protein [Polyangiaceae bacterium]